MSHLLQSVEELLTKMYEGGQKVVLKIELKTSIIKRD